MKVLLGKLLDPLYASGPTRLEAMAFGSG